MALVLSSPSWAARRKRKRKPRDFRTGWHCLRIRNRGNCGTAVSYRRNASAVGSPGRGRSRPSCCIALELTLDLCANFFGFCFERTTIVFVCLRVGDCNKQLTSGSAAVFATEMAFAFAQKVVLVALTSAPVEFLASHALLIVAPSLEVTLTTTCILRLLAFVCIAGRELAFGVTLSYCLKYYRAVWERCTVGGILHGWWNGWCCPGSRRNGIGDKSR